MRTRMGWEGDALPVFACGTFTCSQQQPQPRNRAIKADLWRALAKGFSHPSQWIKQMLHRLSLTFSFSFFVKEFNLGLFLLLSMPVSEWLTDWRIILSRKRRRRSDEWPNHWTLAPSSSNSIKLLCEGGKLTWNRGELSGSFQSIFGASYVSSHVKRVR